MTFLTKDRALALATLVLVAVMLVESRSIPPATSWQPYGSAFYPRLLLWVIGGLALLLLGRSFLPGAERQPPLIPEMVAFAKANHRIVTLFVLFGLYAALLPVVGYIAATAGFLLASLAALSQLETRRKVLGSIAICAVTPLLIFAVFRYGLGIRLP